MQGAQPVRHLTSWTSQPHRWGTPHRPLSAAEHTQCLRRRGQQLSDTHSAGALADVEHAYSRPCHGTHTRANSQKRCKQLDATAWWCASNSPAQPLHRSTIGSPAMLCLSKRLLALPAASQRVGRGQAGCRTPLCACCTRSNASASKPSTPLHCWAPAAPQRSSWAHPPPDESAARATAAPAVRCCSREACSSLHYLPCYSGRLWGCCCALRRALRVETGWRSGWRLRPIARHVRERLVLAALIRGWGFCWPRW